MSSGSSDSRPGVIYNQARSNVYQRFHPVPLKALNLPSTDTSSSANPGNRYYTCGRCSVNTRPSVRPALTLLMNRSLWCLAFF
eukprot:5934171-Pleurochrysis_carterae.AAC.1